MNRQALYKAASVALALAVWQIISMSIGMEMILASPVKVAARFFTLWTEPETWSTVLFSLLRICGGFFAAFALGLALAFLSARFSAAAALLWPYVMAMKAVPVASFIILCLIWFSFTQLTVFIGFLIAFPVIYSNVLQGLQSTDRKLLEMAEVYRLSWKRRLTYIEIPAVMPYLLSACRVAMGMAWKAGVAAEVIGMVNGSIGNALYEARIYFQNADLLAWTAMIIVLSFALEKALVGALKKAYGWMVKR